MPSKKSLKSKVKSSASASSTSAKLELNSLLAQQLQFLEADVGAAVGTNINTNKAKVNKKRRRKRQKAAKRKNSEIAQVASEETKRKRNYQRNVAKLSQDKDRDISVQFVDKVRELESISFLFTRPLNCVLLGSILKYILDPF